MITYTKGHSNKSEQQRIKEESSYQYSVMFTPFSSLNKRDKRRFINFAEKRESIGYQTISEHTMSHVEALFKAEKFSSQKKIMRLYFADGLTVNEIADRLGKHKQSVARSIQMGVEKVQKKLSAKEFDACAWYFRRHKSVNSNQPEPRKDWDKMTTPSFLKGSIEGQCNNEIEWKFIHQAELINEYSEAKRHLRYSSCIGGGLVSEYVESKQLPIPRNNKF